MNINFNASNFTYDFGPDYGFITEETLRQMRQAGYAPPPPRLVEVTVDIAGERLRIMVTPQMRNDMLIKGRQREAQYAEEARRRQQEQQRQRVARTAPARFSTPADAIEHLRTVCGGDTTTDLRRLINRAKRRTHPDLGGSNHAFLRVSDAEQLLRQTGRIP